MFAKAAAAGVSKEVTFCLAYECDIRSRCQPDICDDETEKPKFPT